MLHLGASFALGLYCAAMVNSFPMATPTHAAFTFIAVGCVGFVVATALRAFAHRVHQNSELNPAQLNIEIRESSVGSQAEQRIRLLLFPRPEDDEVNDVINRVNRASKVFLVVRLAFVTSVYLVLMTALIWLMVNPVSFDIVDLGSQPDDTATRVDPEVPYGVPMLVSLVTAFVLVWVWVSWQSRYSVLTNEFWFNAKIWPTWLPRTDSTPSVPITRLELADIEQGAIGKLFKYGTFVTDTGAENDQKIQRFPGMPDPYGFRGSANALRPRTRH